MNKQEKLDKLKEAKELGILTSKEYLKKVNQLNIPMPSNEVFSWKKLLKGMFSLLDPVEWSQTFREIGITDIRKWIIVALFMGALYGWGYVKGTRNKPVHFDMRGKEATIDLNEHKLHILPDGTAQVEDIEGRVLKTIKTKDIPELQKALRPVGFQLKPFTTLGLGASLDKDSSFEGGIGLSWFKIYATELDSFITNKAFYPLGVSYKLHKIKLNNTYLQAGGGIGYKGDKRIYFGLKWLW